MIAFTVVGLAVAMGVLYIPHFGLQQLWWVFNTIAACIMVPTLLTLYWDRVSDRGIFWGVLVAFVVGIPLFIYSNILNNPAWIVGSSLFIVFISTALSVLIKEKRGPIKSEIGNAVTDEE